MKVDETLESRARRMGHVWSLYAVAGEPFTVDASGLEVAGELLTACAEEIARLRAQVEWHQIYVRPPDTPNRPRLIAGVFQDLDALRAACGDKEE